jgi:hypothetical protein
MLKTVVRSAQIADLEGRPPEQSGPPAHSRVQRIAYGLSSVIAVLMVVASLAGLLIDGLYRDGSWAREAFRGGDLTTLLLAAPILSLSLILTIRGSVRAQAVWIGVLAYGAYNYAYYVFGSAFNDVFLLHIGLLTLALWATTLAVASVDVRGVATAFRIERTARWVGAFLAVVGLGLGGLWAVLAIRFALTGELMADIPADGIHLVFAIDLALLVPALVVAGVLLWRRTTVGIVFGTVMTVMGGLYQVNLLLAGLFQANADVPGVKAFPLEGIVLTAGFALALAALFERRRVPAAQRNDRIGKSERWNGRSSCSNRCSATRGPSRRPWRKGSRRGSRPISLR